MTLPIHDLDRILAAALSRGGDFAEVYIEHRRLRSLRIEEGEIRAVRSGEELGAGVRVHSGERTGYACLDGLEPSRLMQAAASAARIASGAPSLPARLVSLEAEPATPAAGAPAPAPLEESVQLARRIDAAARAADARVTQVVAGIGAEERQILVANSEGLLVTGGQTLVGATAMVLAGAGPARQRGFFAGGGRDGFGHFEILTPEAIGREAVRRAVVQLDAIEAPAGPQKVVIGNGWGGVLLHESVGHGFEADFVRRGSSIYAGRIGQRLASNLCTVIDDGSLPGLRGSSRFDDEGTPSQATTIIERGILGGFLHDRLSSRLLRASATGNGRRQSYRHPPLPRQTNLYMAAGPDTPEEIIGSVDRGFYARHLGGGQVDITNGNFVFQVTEGYLIEDGRLTAPVRNANLIGIGHEVLSRITGVGCDLEFDSGMGLCGKEGQSVPVGVGQPTLLISSLTVGGTKV